MTHNENGFPIIPKEVVRECLEMPEQNGVETFMQRRNEMMNNLLEENPDLANAIAAMKMAMLSSLNVKTASEYFVDCVTQLFMMIENAEKKYMKG
ncbi:MAG: hypothetical protein ACOC80_09625 [Petrotogales bacterium]